MSWTPTDEQVEKVARELNITLTGLPPLEAATWAIREAEARAVLVAVGPMIAAQAWDEGMALGHNDPRRLLDKWAENPYRQEAGR